MEDEKKQAPELQLPKIFDKCPNPECGSTRRFALEASKDRANQGEIPYLVDVSYEYKGLVGTNKLIAALDVCVECGTVYAVGLNKLLGFKLKPGGNGDNKGLKL